MSNLKVTIEVRGHSLSTYYSATIASENVCGWGPTQEAACIEAISQMYSAREEPKRNYIDYDKLGV